ncbi:Conserved hypothetical protein [Prochlorococcus marinus str. MIT 9301]|uniref:O-antigen ligase-related domain-containing protein n=2 Tax=Prochlorococcus marinus TaxID=1219 RepID=A3PE45_PROM0|nr:Conserved hypothetical protein [Prochlorococcus marinus str. MIT 9301]
MFFIKKIFGENINKNNYGIFFFRVGIFLLPSAMLISFIFLLISLIEIFFKNFKSFLKDKFNIPFLISIPFFLLSCLIHYSQLNLEENTYLSLLGLFNWIPFFFCFMGFQIYLKSREERILISKILISGTIPLIFSGFSQYFLGWNGPFQTLNGFIVWYQKEGDSLSGVFSNPSYAACWINIIFAFSFSQFLDNGFKNKKSYLLFFITVFLVISSVLTNSYDSIIGYHLIAILILLKDYFLAFATLISTLFFIVLLNLSNFINSFTSSTNIFENTTNPYLSLIYSKLQLRADIFTYSLSSIFEKPFFGWGAGQFGNQSINGATVNHTHNLFYELAYNYGLLVTFLIAFPIFLITLKSFKKIYKFPFSRKNFLENSSLFEKGWWSSFFVLLLSQLVDIQYYDGRISMIFWILLAGLRQTINENY